jgi:hypothetical protein
MIPLIGKDPITHDLWNILFEEFDAKVSRVMDNKTWILTGDLSILPLMGMLFFFVNGPRPQSAFLGGVNYDHKRFTDLAATIPPVLDPDGKPIVDSDKKLLLVTEVSLADKQAVGIGNQAELFFDHCLEAQRRVFQETGKDPALYWLVEAISTLAQNRTPEKIYRFAQAELIIEGTGLETVRMENGWNKFNFFRVHNCNPYAVTVDFAGFYQLAVPAYGVRCVRRKSVSTGYEAGWNFFQRFDAHDPRLYAMPQGNASDSQGANNVVCPSLVFRVLRAFSALYGIGYDGVVPGPKLFVDPHSLQDVSGLYAGYYPAATVAAG